MLRVHILQKGHSARIECASAALVHVSVVSIEEVSRVSVYCEGLVKVDDVKSIVLAGHRPISIADSQQQPMLELQDKPTTATPFYHNPPWPPNSLPGPSEAAREPFAAA